ncbi:unnamed protein product [Enterobius vermicularis]|uniref:Ins145_P3_rec domain-containing protein n=1 Tax=Enterobius vermicularis TaxID=51028 RepID=A0A0N4VNL7_ENTVE|nr:unnamed protein product [Enterobius vermicularis]
MGFPPGYRVRSRGQKGQKPTRKTPLKGSTPIRRRMFSGSLSFNMSLDAFHNTTLHIGDVVSFYTEDRSRLNEEGFESLSSMNSGFLSTLG